MPWNSVWPIGTTSVKNNKTTGNQNTTYIETTMGNSVVGTNTTTTRDHFWDVGSNEDGRHRFINSPGFTVGGTATDAVIGAGMDAVIYAKETNSRVEWFHRNSSGIYQFVPSFKSGTVTIDNDGSTYANLTEVPENVYGEVFCYTSALGQLSGQTAFFRSNGSTVEAWSIAMVPNTVNSVTIALKFGNGAQASGLNVRARKAAGAGGTWNYRLTYRAL